MRGPQTIFDSSLVQFEITPKAFANCYAEGVRLITRRRSLTITPKAFADYAKAFANYYAKPFADYAKAFANYYAEGVR
jgi:hypothetical protein